MHEMSQGDFSKNFISLSMKLANIQMTDDPKMLVIWVLLSYGTGFLREICSLRAILASGAKLFSRPGSNSSKKKNLGVNFMHSSWWEIKLIEING